VEFLSLFGRQGERAHLRARPRSTRSSDPAD
ncbi:MAG: XRE family transcriptional regulator, partial [Actinoallomurus sp.]